MIGPTTLPALPWTGGCQCGAVRYRLSQAPLTLYACHCTECQRQSASAFGLSAWVREPAIEVTGTLAHWARPTDSGRQMHCHFCPHCGTRLWHKVGREPDDGEGAILSVKGGSLDIARMLSPVGHIWTGSRAAGTHIPQGALAYDRAPDSFGPLIDAFRLQYRIEQA